MQRQEHFNTAAKLDQADPEPRQSFAVTHAAMQTCLRSICFFNPIGFYQDMFSSYTSMIYVHNGKSSVILMLTRIQHPGPGKSSGSVTTELVLVSQSMLKYGCFMIA